jgi:hypothetical protein
MAKNDRQKSILLLILIVLAVLVSAPSLTGLQLQSGQPLPSGVNEQSFTEQGSSPTQFEPSSYSFIKGILSLLFVLITLFLFFNLLVHLDWKRSILSVIFLIVLAFLLIVIPKPTFNSTPANSQSEGIPLESNPVAANAPLNAPPQALVWVVIIGLAAVMILGAAWWMTRKRNPVPVVDPIGAEAFIALHALESGEDLNNVLIRCYRQMSLILQQEQMIERDETMTAAEFEQYLSGRGLPQEPIQQLTGLFEKARYSDLALDEQDAEIGWNCLSAISEHCRKEGKNGEK